MYNYSVYRFMDVCLHNYIINMVFFSQVVLFAPPHPIAKLQADEDGQGAAGS